MAGLATSAALSLGQGYVQDLSKDYSAKHFQPTKDPYYTERPGGGTKRRRLPEGCSKQESKAWKSVQNKAYLHDKSLCGCCCWCDNIGWAPLLALIPGIGPLLMFWVHSELIKLANKKFQLPEDLMAKMYGNIAVDLALSLVPLLGSLFSWLHACSTRNAAMIYNYVSKRVVDRNTRLERERRVQEQMSGQYSNYYVASQTQLGSTWQQPPTASMSQPYRQARHV
ncbi:hypothetical protein KAFR_0A06670 [Kazachstania africana CBS 2517]|uniref:Uncharacterized protein n=1 Tax=Kazachstania africana (strain ATCC 22294 / BCRC 22015 / CBS 2517 / CECT 1963 / NBRC 1671 / NRRL Y-8276) TaxID=1071382 RepID=H2AP02_KAZAF|nr:hypothetical protein KAFR_0A06670 [Kazachstania africana CBS 2517]CCF56102.1 hypothetical protein KAFR_0A06670 [Kazachstania africana CBS 2517]